MNRYAFRIVYGGHDVVDNNRVTIACLVIIVAIVSLTRTIIGSAFSRMNLDFSWQRLRSAPLSSGGKPETLMTRAARDVCHPSTDLSLEYHAERFVVTLSEESGVSNRKPRKFYGFHYGRTHSWEFLSATLAHRSIRLFLGISPVTVDSS